jgi:CHAD domain-containing protein
LNNKSLIINNINNLKSDLLEVISSLDLASEINSASLDLREKSRAWIDSKHPNKWHKIRINFRKERFLSDLNYSFYGTLLPQLEKIKMIGKLLGDWHDREVALHWLRAARKSHDESKFRSQENIWMKERSSFLNVARVYVTDLF